MERQPPLQAGTTHPMSSATKPGYFVKRDPDAENSAKWRPISQFNGKQTDEGWFQSLAGYGLDPENPCELTIGLYKMDPGMLHPLHLHTTTAEFYYVLDGSARFTVGDTTSESSVGTAIYIPRGMPHAIATQTDRGVEILYAFEAAEGQSIGTVWLDE